MKTNLGPLEHKIMRIVWKQEKATVYSVIDDFTGEKKPAYTTVMTVMSRLAEKRILNREKNGKVYFYTPAQSREGFINSSIKNTISSFIEKFGEEAIAAFVSEASSLSKTNKQKIISKLKNDS